MRGSETTGRSERKLESALLTHVLMLHPRRLTEEELAVELAVGPADDLQGVESAMAALAEIGLLERDGDFVEPTPAAIRSYELWEG